MIPLFSEPGLAGMVHGFPSRCTRPVLVDWVPAISNYTSLLSDPVVGLGKSFVFTFRAGEDIFYSIDLPSDIEFLHSG